MKNEAEKIDNQQGNGVLPCVSGSKLDPIHHENSKNLIIGCDFGSGKDESRKHLFHYR